MIKYTHTHAHTHTYIWLHIWRIYDYTHHHPTSFSIILRRSPWLTPLSSSVFPKASSSTLTPSQVARSFSPSIGPALACTALSEVLGSNSSPRSFQDWRIRLRIEPSFATEGSVAPMTPPRNSFLFEVFVCMYVCMCICIYIYIYIHTHTHIPLSTIDSSSVFPPVWCVWYIYIYIYIYMYVCMYILPLWLSGQKIGRGVKGSVEWSKDRSRGQKIGWIGQKIGRGVKRSVELVKRSVEGSKDRLNWSKDRSRGQKTGWIGQKIGRGVKKLADVFDRCVEWSKDCNDFITILAQLFGVWASRHSKSTCMSLKAFTIDLYEPQGIHNRPVWASRHSHLTSWRQNWFALTASSRGNSNSHRHGMCVCMYLHVHAVLMHEYLVCVRVHITNHGSSFSSNSTTNQWTFLFGAINFSRIAP